jgi:[acyl-carrier-protein] S-malonyltransferase
MLAGHSLGEYTALVAAGSLDFTAAVGLVAERGRLMQGAVAEGQGAMAAILGLDDEQVRQVCADAAQGQVVEAANLNSPGQVVIAGDAVAVARAIALAREAGAKRAVALPVSVPSHCALMRPAADGLASALHAVALEAPKIPVLHNADAQSHQVPDEIRGLLARQLYSPVRWVETVQRIAAAGVDGLIEMGPGRVLSGLAKRIDRRIETHAVLDPDSLDLALKLGGG